MHKKAIGGGYDLAMEIVSLEIRSLGYDLAMEMGRGEYDNRICRVPSRAYEETTGLQ